MRRNLLVGAVLGTLMCAGSVFGVGGGDTCLAPESVVGPQSVTMDTALATSQGHHASCDPKSGSTWYNSADVWYLYTAASTGLVEVKISGCSSTLNSSTATSLSLWNDCAAADSIQCSRPSTSCSATLQFSTVAGNTYMVRAATFAISSSASSAVRRGTANITFTELAPPPNDTCGTASTISAGTTTWNDALANADGPLPSCVTAPSETAQKDVWYRYTPNTSGVAILASTNTWISVHDDTCPPTSTLACAQGSVTLAITGGASYRIRLAKPTTVAAGSGSVVLTEYALPANDTCENPQEVTAGEYTWDDSGDAVADGPFPSCGVANSAAQRDVWFAYTAGVTGNASVDTRVATATAPGTNNAVTISVFSGCNGTEIACASANASKRWLCFSVVSGQRYLIRLARANSAAREPWKVRINEASAPGGDTWETATALTLGTQSYTNQSTCDDDQYEASTNCFGVPTPGAGVWFYLDPSENGIAIFDSSSGTVDTVFYAYGSDTNGNCNGQLLACSNDLSPQATLGSYISLPAQVGSRIYLRAETRFSNSNTYYQNFTMTTDLVPPYTNDECTGAFALTEGTRTFDSRAASDSPGVSDPTCNAGGNLGPTRHDLWYTWTPTQNGRTRLSTCRNPAPLLGSNVTVLTVYRDCSLAQQIDCNDDAQDRTDVDWAYPCTDEQSALQFISRRDTTYLIRVANHSEYFGPGVLNLSFVPNPCVADYDMNGTRTIDDIFIYLNAWFAGDPGVDVNGDGINIDDIFIFLNMWFAGCP